MSSPVGIETWLQVIAAVFSAIAAAAAAWAAHRQHSATLMQTEFTLVETRRDIYERLRTLINRVLFDDVEFRNNEFMSQYDVIERELNYYFDTAVISWADTALRDALNNRLVTVSTLQDAYEKGDKEIVAALRGTTRAAFERLAMISNGELDMHFLPHISTEMIRRKYNTSTLARVRIWLGAKFR